MEYQAVKEARSLGHLYGVRGSCGVGPQGGILITGSASGAGKTTLLKDFIEAGAKFVDDDIIDVVLKMDGGIALLPQAHGAMKEVCYRTRSVCPGSDEYVYNLLPIALDRIHGIQDGLVDVAHVFLLKRDPVYARFAVTPAQDVHHERAAQISQRIQGYDGIGHFIDKAVDDGKLSAYFIDMPLTYQGEHNARIVALAR